MHVTHLGSYCDETQVCNMARFSQSCAGSRPCTDNQCFKGLPGSAHPFDQASKRVFGIGGAECASPDHGDAPSCRCKPRLHFPVTLDVTRKFISPEGFVGAWGRAPMTGLMPMPEAAVDKNGDMMTRQDDIGTPRQVADVQSKPEPGTMQSPPKQHLRLRVRRPDSGHHPGPGRSINYVHHGIKTGSSCAR